MRILNSLFSYFLPAVKLLYGVVLVFGILLALVTLHGFKSVGDPVTPIGILDKLSFIMGVHDKQAVTVLHIGKFHTNSKGFLRVDGMRKKLHDEMFCFCLVHMQCSLLRPF